jgi:hypothetical protein
MNIFMHTLIKFIVPERAHADVCMSNGYCRDISFGIMVLESEAGHSPASI